MDLVDVPQERNSTLDGQRKVVYDKDAQGRLCITCLLYTSPSSRDS